MSLAAPGFFELCPRVEITHFGAFTGQNRWSRFDVGIIIGREQPPPESIECLARALYADAPRPTLNFGGEYVTATRQYEPGGTRWADFDAHPDPAVNEIWR
ncbi:MAG TPA: hypothetical protein VGM72_00350 [Micropepsaceae bacterium]